MNFYIITWRGTPCDKYGAALSHHFMPKAPCGSANIADLEVYLDQVEALYALERIKDIALSPDFAVQEMEI